jgi:hypothetical protein
MATGETRVISVGDKVMVCGGRPGVVEQTTRRGKERYYVRFFKKDGTVGKMGGWCHPGNLKLLPR